MNVPPEIIVKGVEMTPLIDELITRGISRLERICDYIISTRIAIERAQRRHQVGNPYSIRIDIRIAGGPDIIVKRLSKTSWQTGNGLEQLQTSLELQGEEEPIANQLPVRSSARVVREESLQTLIQRAFDSAQRELKKIVERQRGEVKTQAQQQMQAVVEQIFDEQEYGFLRDLDGQEIYFHKNSVLHNHWEHLRPGTAVRYMPEIGKKGLQASTVELVNKPGVAEMHGKLHDLPRVS